MRVFQITRRVAHSANDMFALVADMERYPEFVPLCQRNAIRSRDIGSKVQVLTTEMTVAYKSFARPFEIGLHLIHPMDGFSSRPRTGQYGCNLAGHFNHTATVAPMLGSPYLMSLRAVH